MKPFRWSSEKNRILRDQRSLSSFEAVVVAIESGELLDVASHPNPTRYPVQQILVVRIDGYIHLVPFVERDEYIFLKTIIPSRKATRRYQEAGPP
ncbi:MAG: toxin [Cyanobium sp.]